MVRKQKKNLKCIFPYNSFIILYFLLNLLRYKIFEINCYYFFVCQNLFNIFFIWLFKIRKKFAILGDRLKQISLDHSGQKIVCGFDLIRLMFIKLGAHGFEIRRFSKLAAPAFPSFVNRLPFAVYVGGWVIVVSHYFSSWLFKFVQSFVQSQWIWQSSQSC